jgi:hypothetical protein
MCSGRCAVLPPLHVRLDVKQVFEANTPWLPGRCLKHEAPELGMEYGCGCFRFPERVNIRRHIGLDLLTSHPLSVSPEHLRPLAATFRHWPMLLECPPVAEKAGPCGFPDRSRPQDTPPNSPISCRLIHGPYRV